MDANKVVNKVSAEKCFHWTLFTEHFLANIISKLFGEFVVQKAVQKYVQKSFKLLGKFSVYVERFYRSRFSLK